jgi:hypothetical protein
MNRFLNNKGQSLVMFVMILPILLMIIMMVIDIGKMVQRREELDSINYILVDYGLDNIELNNLENKLKEILDKNDKSIDIVKINIDKESLEVEVILRDEVDLLILKDNKLFRVKSDYIGRVVDNKKIIERNK